MLPPQRCWSVERAVQVPLRALDIPGKVTAPVRRAAPEPGNQPWGWVVGSRWAIGEVRCPPCRGCVDLCVHLGRHGEDRGACARLGPCFLRSPGRFRPGPRPRRPRRPSVQPARRGRHPRDVRTLGALIDRRDAANTLADSLARRLEAIAREQQHRSPRPRVFFEEWDEPLIAGDRLGFRADRDRRRRRRLLPSSRGCRGQGPHRHAGRHRGDQPDVILASWCGKKVVPDRIRSRPGWDQIPAVAANRIFEIKSPLILQPGPAAFTDGLDAILAALEYP